MELVNDAAEHTDIRPVEPVPDEGQLRWLQLFASGLLDLAGDIVVAATVEFAAKKIRFAGWIRDRDSSEQKGSPISERHRTACPISIELHIELRFTCDE